MTEKILEKLVELGLSSRQALLYLTILQNKNVNIKQISKKTGIHTQDVYKLLMTLEKKGLVLRTRTKPLTIEAIPLQLALKMILKNHKMKAKEELDFLKRTLKETNELIEKEKNYNEIMTNLDPNEIKVYVLDSQKHPNVQFKVSQTLANLKKDYAAITPVGANQQKYDIDIDMDQIANKGVRMRWLLLRNKKEGDLNFLKAYKQRLPSKAQIKTISINEKFCYAITDRKEVWFRLYSEDENPENTSLLLTNSKGIVDLAIRQFESLWNDPSAQKV